MQSKRVNLILIVPLLMLTVISCSFFGRTVSVLPTMAAPQVTLPAPILAPTSAVSSSQPTPLVEAAPSTASIPGSQTYVDVYKQVNPSVVHIRVVLSTSSSTSSNSTTPFAIPNLPAIPGLPGSPTQAAPSAAIPDQAIGSGFVYDTQGHIVTNNHVTSDATRIIVTFYDGTTAVAKLVGADPDSDLAVIQVNGFQNMLKPVTFGDSTSIPVGEMVVAFGNPFGLQNSMSAGIISGLGRLLSSSDQASSTGTNYSIPDILQTDAPINPGNSGGPLVTLNGEVIGVNTAIETQSGTNSGVGYAVPSALVKKVVPELISKGSMTHSWLGIAGGSMDIDLATAMNLDPNQHGVLISEVVPGGPGEKAGLKGSSTTVTIDGEQTQVGGDIIVGINDHPVNVFDDLLGYVILNGNVGEAVTLHIIRDGKPMDVSLTLQARPKSQ
ncbi:MAG: trypsin-like peptidase domain-containing protein [Anaerolineaceae bacterium]|nr:trypsin-like peptidase domain-containing protein [Anaerolineaceae bacterium]